LAGKSAQGTNRAKPASVDPEIDGLKQEEVARRAGCAQSTVSRAVARGDIVPLTNGRLPESAIDILRKLRKEDEKASAETAELERRLLAAETGEREAKQKLRELELQRESGKYVELDEVQKSGADVAQRILAVLRAMPQRIALEVEAALTAPPGRRAAAIEKIIALEVERAIGEMRESMYLQAKDDKGGKANG
jgi:hypothetical protein